MGDQDFDDVPNNSAAWVKSIASMYNVPARIGGAIRYTGGKAPRFGTIKGACGRNNPGLMGFEIIHLAQRLQEPLKERTVRTALHRLKDDKIESRERRWYPIALEAS